MAYIERVAIKVKQPLGTFYVASISARQLLQVCYSDPAELRDDGFHVDGTQRVESEKRLREISAFIETHEAAFPNAIILGANYNRDGEYVDSADIAWSIVEEGDAFRLIVPTQQKLASIIDGQHRLKAFEYCSDEYKDMDLLCAIYIDLPIPYHAFIFSTINFNQKKVDRSLAYNLFGFDIESSNPSTWVPETLAVSIARRLNNEDGPLKGRVSLGVLDASRVPGGDFTVSMATIVDGVLKLISKRPKRDRTDLMKLSKQIRSRLNLGKDDSPLRSMYLEGYDEAIYEIVANYFRCVDELLWSEAEVGSYITKTVGIQALFDVLSKLLIGFEDRLDGEYQDFMKRLEPIRGLRFDGAQASGIGRTFIKNKILNALELRDL